MILYIKKRISKYISHLIMVKYLKLYKLIIIKVTETNKQTNTHTDRQTDRQTRPTHAVTIGIHGKTPKNSWQDNNANGNSKSWRKWHTTARRWKPPPSSFIKIFWAGSRIYTLYWVCGMLVIILYSFID